MSNYDKILTYIKEIVELLSDSNTLKKVFSDYQQRLEYTKQVKFDDTIKAIKEIIDILESELIII